MINEIKSYSFTCSQQIAPDGKTCELRHLRFKVKAKFNYFESELLFPNCIAHPDKGLSSAVPRSPASHFAAAASLPALSVRRLNWQQPLNWRASPLTQYGPARLSSLSPPQCANVTKAEAVDLILSDELLHFRYLRKIE